MAENTGSSNTINSTTTTKTTKNFLNPVRLSYKDPSVDKSVENAANVINAWHKFILYNVAKEDKNLILDAIIEICAPGLFIPVKYQMETDTKATFLSMCRSNVISRFVNQKMQLKLKNGKIVYYDIVLSYLTFKEFNLNVLQIISNVIKARFSKESIRKTLNLQNFSTDKLLGSVYCPLHIPVVFDNILRLSKTVIAPINNRDAKLPIRDLILRNNNLESLVFTEKVFSFVFSKIDLRNNKLYDVTLLKPFSEYKITELWLDGNPLCSNYSSAKDYVTAVKCYFPHLQLLDGEIIGIEDKQVPIYHKHFVQDKIKINLVKQFLEHFFTCYDQEDRLVFNGLYDAGALFSMTIGPITDNSQKQIIKSFATNRNLLKFVDYAKCTEFLLYGPEKIITALRREPATLHKMKFLDIDLLYSTSNSFAVFVQGPFVYRKTNVPPMWFTRTLIVVAKEDNEFCIINDQYHIDNCPPSLNNVDLSELKIVTQHSVPQFNPISFSGAEKYQLLRLLQELTTMNDKYSEKYLIEASWDIRQAIKTFMQQYLSNRVPTEAFK
ncbi:nuclear RNA export factor 2 [Nasonia vitripennis]|uniref:Uncharacterized protein n=1 Tax=Nasonia vitripennis TaxID=7425 RepID=A0A7M7LNU9_NASVI|nr:nuclear RNA export factor 2 [Nasonia vitripennis]